ncbi:alkylation response protein AidB-like acyl-CoA dehydrogenase [Streptosporangium becharense]|uniref:Alkylation response protein AidB-like acyl-CoA dehydrogenase n=1 Tax=Streptosporangium becharense TaxID=1816182 RepID=A0A7W9MIR3_9ACTN|nr:acyl-CoA dehydrogenase family protein [Streptosporangium becharense]MBB2911036.1 alkylation response protein AidB-like acyl-CoA dehydrogenase [Streptosporangium becharense]MBB5821906.1 alkylation response protein AidB-like acyl-CoA dehydrogenase [Streptosporangium becharense]
MLVDTRNDVTETPPGRVPGHAELVARAAGLRADLWADAAESERTRRLTGRVVSGITEAGLTRLMTPRRLGGYQTSIRTLLDVTAELGRGCCSAGWVTGVLNAGNFVVSLFPETAQDEVWGTNPDARTALVLGMPARGVTETDGGVLVTGRWAYASGCRHADWIGVLIAVGGGSGGPVVHFALMRMDEVSVEDTWHFAGMRGTGSDTVVADRVFVPRHRLLPYLPVLNGETDGVVDPSHHYRNSLTGLFSIGLIGSLVGGAEEAFRYVQEKAPTRPAAGSTYANQAESPTLQLDLAAAATKVDSARMLAMGITDRIDRFAAAGENPDLVTRARARMDSTQTGQLCREAVDLLLTAYGSSAFNEANPLQRIWRDVNVGSRHAGFGMGIPQQVYGRALVGGDPREISLLV